MRTTQCDASFCYLSSMMFIDIGAQCGLTSLEIRANVTIRHGLAPWHPLQPVLQLSTLFISIRGTINDSPVESYVFFLKKCINSVESAWRHTVVPLSVRLY